MTDATDIGDVVQPPLSTESLSADEQQLVSEAQDQWSDAAVADSLNNETAAFTVLQPDDPQPTAEAFTSDADATAAIIITALTEAETVQPPSSARRAQRLAGAAACLPYDPLFPSLPSAQLLAAVAASDAETAPSSSPATAQHRAASATASTDSDGASAQWSRSPLFDASLHSADAFTVFSRLPAAPVSIEQMVQEKMRWRSAAAAACTALAPAFLLLRLLADAHLAVCANRESHRVERTERVARRRVELLAELERLVRATFTAGSTQQQQQASASSSASSSKHKMRPAAAAVTAAL